MRPGALVLLLGVVCSSSALADSWSASVSAALLRHRSDTDTPIVALVCPVSEQQSVDEVVACEQLRQRLADGMIERGIHVVVPWRSFDLVRSWDHVQCGDAPADHLGWSTLELVLAERQAVQIVDRDSGLVLHAGEPGPTTGRGQDRWYPPFMLSHQNDPLAAVVSHLARMLICELKAMPVKNLIDSVQVYGEPGSPARLLWVQQVGEQLQAALNRVLRSGYSGREPTTLELEIVARRGDAFELVPRIVEWIETEQGSEPRLQVDGSIAPADRVCLVRSRGELSSQLGDLTVFERDLRGLRAYLEGRGLSLEIERVRSEAPIGQILGQHPEATVAVGRVPGRRVHVQLSDGRRDTGSLDGQLEAIGAALEITPELVRACREAARDSPRLRAALEELIRDYDPLGPGAGEQVQRRWAEFAHPRFLPYFPGSPANLFVRAVAERLKTIG